MAFAFGRPSGELTPRADHPTLRGIVMAEGNHMFSARVPCRTSTRMLIGAAASAVAAQEDADRAARVEV